jgi:hypothetical protein
LNGGTLGRARRQPGNSCGFDAALDFLSVHDLEIHRLRENR